MSLPSRFLQKPWTNITDDASAVSHLVSIYFTWSHHGYPSVDQDIFVREMNSKDLSSQFCSPFLVNSILMVACMHTDHPIAFADPDNISSRGLHFWNEATRLWALEHGKVSLSNSQALPPFIAGVVALGKDRDGINYIGQSITLSSELAREVQKGLKRGHQEFSTKDFQRSYALARWALYRIQVEVAVAWSKPLDIWKPSKRYLFTTEELQHTRMWQPYPNTGSDVTMFPSVLIMESIKLYEIAAELQPLLLSGSPQDSPLPGHIVLDQSVKYDRLLEIETTLLEWYQNLPVEARVGNMDESLPTIPLTDLHLAYYCFQIATANQIIRITGITEADTETAAENVTSVCQNIARIFEWVQRTIGLSHFGIYHVHAASLGVYGALEHLTKPGMQDIFHTMIVALSAAYNRWNLARGIVRMVWIELQQRRLDQVLNQSTLDLLKLSAVDSWGPEDHRLFEKCAYPNYAVAGERGAMLAEMGDLLDQYARLHLEDKSTENESG